MAMKLRHGLMAVMSAGAMFAGHASMAATTYYLNNSNLNPVIQTYATVTVDQVGTDVKFIVSVAPALIAQGWALDEFGFNWSGAGAAPALSYSGLADVDPDAEVVAWSDNGSGNMDGFGSFDFRVGGNGQAGRAQPVEFLVLNRTLADLIGTTGDPDCTGSDGCFFGVHIVGLAGTPAASALTFFASGGGDDPFTEVPIPAAAWLLGSGLLGLFGVARRRRPVA